MKTYSTLLPYNGYMISVSNGMYSIVGRPFPPFISLGAAMRKIDELIKQAENE